MPRGANSRSDDTRITTAPGGSGISINYRTSNPQITRTYEQRLGLLPAPPRANSMEDAIVIVATLALGYILTRPSVAASTNPLPGQYSLPSTSTPAVITRLPTPISTRFVNSTATTATVAVNNVSGAKAYQWYNANTNALLASSSSTTAVITGLQPNTDYLVYVVAVGSNGAESYPSSPMTIYTPQQ